MKIKIKKDDLVFKNDINLNFEENKGLIIFAPNGTCKSSIYKKIENWQESDEELGLFDISNPSFYLLNNEELLNFNIYNLIIDLDHFCLKENNSITEIKDKFINSIKSKDKEGILSKENNEDIFNKILKKIDNIVKYNPQEEIEKIRKLHPFIEKIPDNKIPTCKQFIDKYKKFQENNKRNIEIYNDFLIIKEIFYKNRQEFFMYKWNGIYMAISENILNSLEGEILNTVDENELNIFNVFKNEINKTEESEFIKIFKSNTSKKIKTQKGYVWDEVLSNLYFDKFILDNFKYLKNIFSEFNDNIKKSLKIINNRIEKINNWFEKPLLEITINIPEIEYKDIFNLNNINIKLKRGNKNISNIDELSDGEKRIIILMLEFSMIDENDILVLDDVLTSLDSSHIGEFIDIITCEEKLFFENKKNSDIQTIFMTHNFEIFRSIAINFKNNNKCDYKFLIFDRNNKDNIEEIEICQKEIANLMFSKEISKPDKKSKIIEKYSYIFILSNILRETIANHLLTKDKSDNLSLDEFIHFLDNNFRHFKNKSKTNSSLIEEVKKFNLLIESIPIIKDFIDVLELFEPNENLISSFLKIFNENNKNLKTKNLYEYISKKVMQGLYIRFKFELEFIYNSNDKDMIDSWEGIKNWEDNKKFQKTYNMKNQLKNKKIKSFDENFLIHINSLQWSKIIEMPTKKIEKVIEIYTKNK
ncbi:MAG: hypothetical protein ACRDBR_00380 [Metamycoplasmataceae bacterium]